MASKYFPKCDFGKCIFTNRKLTVKENATHRNIYELAKYLLRYQNRPNTYGEFSQQKHLKIITSLWCKIRPAQALVQKNTIHFVCAGYSGPVDWVKTWAACLQRKRG